MAYATSRMKGASAVNLVIGALLVAAPFLTATSTVAFWSAIFVGALIAALAIFDLYEESHDHAERVGGPSLVTVLAGLWLIASTFLLAASTTYLWVVGLSGLIVVLAAGFNFSEARRLQGRAGDV